MPEARPPHLDEVMIAAAKLEDAEFERDRLVMACAVAIRSALAAGLSPAQVALAADLTELDVLGLAETAPAGAAISSPLSAVGTAPRQEASLTGVDAPLAGPPSRQGGYPTEVPQGAGQEPDATL